MRQYKQDNHTNPIFENYLYSGASGTLASRIDKAWEVFKDDKSDEKNREVALNFLIYAFDLNDCADINLQLIALMEDRDKHKNINPNFIPGKSDFKVPFNPAVLVPKRTGYTGQSRQLQVHKAILTGELLDVTTRGKEDDRRVGTKYLRDTERAEHRVLIHKGLFKKNGVLFDSQNMCSHSKKGFASFTLNTNGELLLFNHIGMIDKIGHSSMNAGAPVISAGEIKIESGQLKAITTYSGHYWPSLFNVYRVLEYFDKQGVNISEAEIITFRSPARVLEGVITNVTSKNNGCCGLRYSTPATDIYSGVKGLLKQSLSSINNNLENYQKGGLKTSLFKFKDWFFKSNLTEQREHLANEAKNAIASYNQENLENLSDDERQSKAGEYAETISDFVARNNDISNKHSKDSDTGRLANKLAEFRFKLQAIRDGKDIVQVDKDLASSLKYTH